MTGDQAVQLYGLICSGVLVLGLGGKGLHYVRAIARGFRHSL